MEGDAARWIWFKGMEVCASNTYAWARQKHDQDGTLKTFIGDMRRLQESPKKKDGVDKEELCLYRFVRKARTGPVEADGGSQDADP